jgi:hypothetical protein
LPAADRTPKGIASGKEGRPPLTFRPATILQTEDAKKVKLLAPIAQRLWCLRTLAES